MAMYPCLFCGGAPSEANRLVCEACDALMDRYGHDEHLYQAFCYGALLAARSVGLTGPAARGIAQEADTRRRGTDRIIAVFMRMEPEDSPDAS